VVSSVLQPLYARQRPLPIVGTVWTTVKKRKYLGPTGVKTPNRPADNGIYYISGPLHS
jgi:hypothetical protein